MMRIRTKLLTSACVAVFLASVISNTVAYVYFTYVFRTEILKEQQSKLDNTVRQIDRILAQLKSGGAAFVVEPRIQGFLRTLASARLDRVQRVLSTQKLMNHLIYLLTLQENVVHATLIDARGNEYWTLFPVQSFSPGGDIRPSDVEWPLDRGPVLFGPYTVMQQRGVTERYIGYLLPVYDVYDPRVRLGWCVLHVRLRNLQKILDDDTSGLKNASASLNGLLLWESPGSGGQTPAQGHLLLSRSPSGVSLQSFVDEKAFFYKLRGVGLIFIGTTLLALAIYVCFLVPLLLRLLSPLNELYRAVLHAADGDFDHGPVVRSGDELQVLADQFNAMLDQIKAHIQNQVATERMMRKTEYDLLVAQINPHFLYNTLNSIKFLSHLGKRAAVDRVVDSLIEIMQGTVGKRDSLLLTTVRSEIELVRKYLVIQKYQYADGFSVVYDVHEEAMDFSMPGFIIQPLVENALFHGVCPRGGKGTISVRCGLTEDGLALTVQDDGVGADAAAIRELIDSKAREADGRSMRSIGLANIRERLRLLYGDRQSFSITTAPGGGFTVSVLIPNG